jgi:uncharacterized protein (TIGR03089 family)
MTGSLLDAALADDPGRPFVTYYDDSTGERVELSVTTLANWVAKTGNLLVDGLGVQPGDELRLDLPRHWQLPVWAFAAWTVGLVVDLDGTSRECRVAVCGPEGIDAATAAAEDVVALSLRPLGAPFPAGTLPPGALDYGREVGGFGDRYSGPVAGPEAAAVRSGETLLTLADAQAHAAALAVVWGLGRRGRLHVYQPLDALTELLAASLVPLSVGGSVVLTRSHATEEAPDEGSVGDILEARARAERTTAVATGGNHPGGLRRP